MNKKELNDKIKFLLKKTGDQSFDVGRFTNPLSGNSEYVIGEFCSFNKGDEILTTDGLVVAINSVDTCDVDSNWFNWLREIIDSESFHLAKASVRYRTLIDWDEV